MVNKRRVYVGTDVRVTWSSGIWISTDATLSDDSLSRFVRNDLDVTLVARRTGLGQSRQVAALNSEIAVLPIDSEKPNARVGRLLLAVFHIARIKLGPNDVVFVRLPEVIGTLLALRALVSGTPIVSNVVAEPDTYASRFGPLEGVARATLLACYRFIVSKSSAAVYVTEQTLQRRFPPSKMGRDYYLSNVRLSESDLADEPAGPYEPHQQFRLVSVGSMSADVKGFGFLIEAVAIARAQGYNVTLDLLGDGEFRNEFEQLAKRLGIGRFVKFHGYVSAPSEVRAVYRRSNLFVLASLAEGLPRAMIEAMSNGVPCFGTNVGGIPELVPREFLVPPGDPTAIFGTLERLIGDPLAARELALCQMALARDIVARANSGLLAQCLAEAK